MFAARRASNSSSKLLSRLLVQQRPPTTCPHRNFGARVRRRGVRSEEGIASAEVKKALAQALACEAEPLKPEEGGILAAEAQLLENRVAAVRRLATLNESSAQASQAEEALHKLLLEAAAQGAEEVQNAVDESLWKIWHESGDSEVNAIFTRGMALLEKDHIVEAIEVFSEVVVRAPDFAEGWNKRATARFLAKDIDGALEDCERVLALKPKHFGCLTGVGMCHQQRGDLKKAVHWFRRALAVHPGMRATMQMAEEVHSQSIINERLRPRIVDIVQAWNDSSRPPSQLLPDGVSCSYDIWRTKASSIDGENCWRYFFRMRVLNRGSSTNELRSMARFYVFRFIDGRMCPITRWTKGAAGFALMPGEDYRFSWHLITGQELQKVAAGLLLERCGPDAGEEESERILDVDLGEMAPSDASEDEVERFQLGYHYNGQLDLRQLGAGPQTHLGKDG